MPKNNNFIYLIFQKIRYWINSIKTLHENLKQTNLLDGKEITFINPYQRFLDWLLDICVDGLIITFIYNMITGWQGWKNILLVPFFGICVYVFLDLVKRTSKSIRGEN